MKLRSDKAQATANAQVLRGVSFTPGTGAAG